MSAERILRSRRESTRPRSMAATSRGLREVRGMIDLEVLEGIGVESVSGYNHVSS